ncbi:MAG: hypothetical protein J6D11_03880 [Clostridia bacterium]|nr:hypothetical protein [Clostridia bacterium]
MYISDSIIKRAINNVYFIWGRGKTTIANLLNEKYGFYVYSTDNAKDYHWGEANPEEQPYMCRNYIKEYGVKSFWELPKEVIADREYHIQKEVTPMIIVDLIALAKKHKIIICEGDIDYHTIAPIATHTVHLRNCGKEFDWFNRPDHSNLNEIKNRTDLSETEKEAFIQNAYAAVSCDQTVLPDWVLELNIKNIDWNDDTGVERTLADVAEYFSF